MYARMYIGPFCRDLAGIGMGLPSSHVRPDPEGFFRQSRHHTTDTRLDPKVRDEAGNVINFSALRKGDVVKVRLVLETHTCPQSRLKKTKLGIHTRAQAITVVKRSEAKTTVDEPDNQMDWAGVEEQVAMTPVSDEL